MNRTLEGSGLGGSEVALGKESPLFISKIKLLIKMTPTNSSLL